VYPGWEALEKEAQEERPVIYFTVKDNQDKVVNRIAGSTSAGFHRASWNLRYVSSASTGGSGPLVPPGTYTVSAEKRVQDEVTPLGQPQTVTVVNAIKPALPAQDSQESLAFYDAVSELQRVIRGTSNKTDEVLSQLAEISSALRQSRQATAQLVDTARNLELKLKALRRGLSGGSIKSRYDEPDQISLTSRVYSAGSGMRPTYGPTKTQRQDYEIARTEFEAIQGQVKKLIERDFANLQKKLESARVPWTAGRPLPQ